MKSYYTVHFSFINLFLEPFNQATQALAYFFHANVIDVILILKNIFYFIIFLLIYLIYSWTIKSSNLNVKLFIVLSKNYLLFTMRHIGYIFLPFVLKYFFGLKYCQIKSHKLSKYLMQILII